MPADELVPGSVAAPFGCRSDTMTPENVADSLVTERVGEITDGPGGCIVATSRIVLRHRQDQFFDFWREGSRCRNLPAIQCWFLNELSLLQHIHNEPACSLRIGGFQNAFRPVLPVLVQD